MTQCRDSRFFQHGAYYTGSPSSLNFLDGLFERLEVLPLTYSAAKRAGSIAADLQRRGTMIGVTDIIIGSIALEADEIVVTRDRNHFSRINGLQVESY